MRFSLFRTLKKGIGESAKLVEHNDLINNMLTDTPENTVQSYREVFLSLERPDGWERYK